MSCNINGFQKVSNITDYTLLGNIEENLKSYFEWNFLNLGGFVNVNSGLVTLSNFRPATGVPSDIHSTSSKNKIWETEYKQWVWETGVQYNSYSPINISGVYVNNIFLPSPTGSGSYGYKLDYPNGRIVFDKEIPLSSKVTLNYSYHKYQVYRGSETSWWGQFKNSIYSDLTNDHLLQTPSIIIEPAPQSLFIPYQLGSNTFFVDQDFLVYIFCSTAIERNNLADIIRLQKDHTIDTYNINNVISNKKYPINYDGSVNTSGLGYNSMILNFYENKLFFKNTSIMGLENYSNKLFWCILRITTQTVSS